MVTLLVKGGSATASSKVADTTVIPSLRMGVGGGYVGGMGVNVGIGVKVIGAFCGSVFPGRVGTFPAGWANTLQARLTAASTNAYENFFIATPWFKFILT